MILYLSRAISSVVAHPLYITYQCTESSILYEFSLGKNFVYTKELSELRFLNVITIHSAARDIDYYE